MKKFFVSILTIIIATTCVFAVSCSDNVKNGSKVQKVEMTLQVYNATGEVEDTITAYFELYLNFAPESTAHIINLINEGFYNGTCVSNVNANWMELGQYQFDAEDKMVEKEYNYGTVIGEFLNNGLKGNRLTTSKGSIIFKREYDDNTVDTDQSKYDTAESTLAFCFTASSASTFNANSYCVLGKVLDDDATPDADNDLDKKSSIDKLVTLADYKETKVDNQTITTYYYEKEGKYYTKWLDEDGVTRYAEGDEVNMDAVLSGTQLEEFNELFNDNTNYFLVVPSVKIVIESMKLC